nr:hypothetical protein I308_05176 [Cryptococcus tetragattii IND107]
MLWERLVLSYGWFRFFHKSSNHIARRRPRGYPLHSCSYGHWHLFSSVPTLWLKSYLFHCKSSHRLLECSPPSLGVSVCTMKEATRSNPCGQYSSPFVVRSRDSRQVVCTHSGRGNETESSGRS